MLAALTPAIRLALQNAQLAAVAKARLADVQASQRRVVAASDSERRRIERDLHDGAQQRLVSVAFHLKVALRVPINRLPCAWRPQKVRFGTRSGSCADSRMASFPACSPTRDWPRLWKSWSRHPMFQPN